VLVLLVLLAVLGVPGVVGVERGAGGGAVPGALLGPEGSAGGRCPSGRVARWSPGGLLAGAVWSSSDGCARVCPGVALRRVVARCCP
jgi:hypothetical protein